MALQDLKMPEWYRSVDELILTGRLNLPIRWKCPKCYTFLDELISAKQIEAYLENFKAKKYKSCKQNRHRNWFEISREGVVKFFVLDKKCS